MQNIEFNEDNFLTMDGRDWMKLIKHLTGDWTLQNKRRIVVNKFATYESLEPGNEKMITVVVEFQTWKEGQYGFGDFYEWRAFRAKDHCCGNYSIKQITGQYQNYQRALK